MYFIRKQLFYNRRFHIIYFVCPSILKNKRFTVISQLFCNFTIYFGCKQIHIIILFRRETSKHLLGCFFLFSMLNNSRVMTTWLNSYITNRGIPEKGLGDVVSAVCYTLYIHYISIPLHTNSWDDISRTLFVNSPVAKQTVT